MRMLLVALVVALGGAGCGDDTTASGFDEGVPAADMAQHGDLAIAVCGDAGTKAFGMPCTTDCECSSSMCRPFQMGAAHFCTKPCTMATQAADCPMPPSTGICTNNGYCKF